MLAKNYVRVRGKYIFMMFGVNHSFMGTNCNWGSSSPDHTRKEFNIGTGFITVLLFFTSETF